MKKFKQGNITIEINEAPEISVLIDNKSIEVSQDEEAQQFTTAALPYYSFKTLEDLAKKVATNYANSLN